MSDYFNVPPFRAWLQRFLPAVYDDALSEQELLYKMIHYLNTVVEGCQNLEDYVTHYLDGIDITGDVENYINQLIEDGTLQDYINIDMLNDRVYMKHTLNSIFFQPIGRGVNPADVTATNVTSADLAAWRAEIGADVPYLPGGTYTNSGDGNLANVNGGRIGNATVYNAGTVGTYPNNIINLSQIGLISNHVTYTGTKVAPQIAVSSVITDNSGGDSLTTCCAGIYSYVEQNGTNTRQAPKAIMGVSVNGAGGDNDSTGVVGYSYKRNIPPAKPADPNQPGGIGDCAGAGGACWQFSSQTGLAIGGEFSCHQQVAGTTANDGATGHNKSMALHVTTNSIGSACANGIAFDGGGNDSGYYSFWNAICFAPSTFGQNGQVATGTTLLNFHSCTTLYPDMAFKMGNAGTHFWRDSGNIRLQADGLDCHNDEYTNFGLRFIGSSPFIGFYTGTVGADGTSSTTAKGSITSTAAGALSLRSYDATGDDTTTSWGVIISKAEGAVYPTSSNVYSLGRNNALWTQVFAASGTINTSDKRFKTEICEEGSEEFDKALEAVDEVLGKCFKFNDAIQQKGMDKARKHFGYYAQDIIEAFERHGLDAFEYGVVCTLDTNKEESSIMITREIDTPAVTDDEGNILKEATYKEVEMVVDEGREAVSMYAVRYQEFEVLKSACLKRRLERLEKKLENLANEE